MLLSNCQTVVPVNRSIISPGTFTASPVDMKLPSPGSSKRYDNDGVGLGIVAALEKSGIRIIPVCYSGSGSNTPDPVYSARRFHFRAEIDLSEEYTCVTSRDGITKVYYNDDDDFEFCQNRPVGDRRLDKFTEGVEESPAKKREVLRDSPDFLRLCCLCKKKLQGKDIYMYKGDKGFCSKECRAVKIMEDSLNQVQHKSTSLEVLSSPYAGGQISPAGIFVL